MPTCFGFVTNLEKSNIEPIESSYKIEHLAERYQMSSEPQRPFSGGGLRITLGSKNFSNRLIWSEAN